MARNIPVCCSYKWVLVVPHSEEGDMGREVVSWEAWSGRKDKGRIRSLRLIYSIRAASLSQGLPVARETRQIGGKQ